MTTSRLRTSALAILFYLTLMGESHPTHAKSQSTRWCETTMDSPLPISILTRSNRDAWPSITIADIKGNAKCHDLIWRTLDELSAILTSPPSADHKFVSLKLDQLTLMRHAAIQSPGYGNQLVTSAIDSTCLTVLAKHFDQQWLVEPYLRHQLNELMARTLKVSHWMSWIKQEHPDLDLFITESDSDRLPAAALRIIANTGSLLSDGPGLLDPRGLRNLIDEPNTHVLLWRALGIYIETQLSLRYLVDYIEKTPERPSEIPDAAAVEFTLALDEETRSMSKERTLGMAVFPAQSVVELLESLHNGFIDWRYGFDYSRKGIHEFVFPKLRAHLNTPRDARAVNLPLPLELVVQGHHWFADSIPSVAKWNTEEPPEFAGARLRMLCNEGKEQFWYLPIESGDSIVTASQWRKERVPPNSSTSLEFVLLSPPIEEPGTYSFRLEIFDRPFATNGPSDPELLTLRAPAIEINVRTRTPAEDRCWQSGQALLEQSFSDPKGDWIRASDPDETTRLLATVERLKEPCEKTPYAPYLALVRTMLVVEESGPEPAPQEAMTTLKQLSADQDFAFRLAADELGQQTFGQRWAVAP